MNHAIGFLTTAYVLCVFPLLLSEVFDTVFRLKRKGPAAAYAKGGILVFALFWVEAQVCLHAGKRSWMTLSFLTKIFVASAAMLGILGLIAFLIRRPKQKIHRKHSKVEMAAIVMGILAIAFALFVVIPPAEDTVAYVQAAVQTDTIFEYEPYAMEHYPELYHGQRLAPAEMLFAAICSLTGAAPLFVVKTAAAVFLILMSFAVTWFAGTVLLADRKKTAVFFLLVLAMDARLAFAAGNYYSILLTPWRRETILLRIVLPVAVVFGYELCKILLTKKGIGACFASIKNAQAREALLLLIAAFPAAELFDLRGIVYAGLIALLWAVTLVVGKLWQK